MEDTRSANSESPAHDTSAHDTRGGSLGSSAIAIALVLLILVIGGGYALLRWARTEATAIDLVPLDALAYATLDLSPSGAQRAAVQGLFRRFPEDRLRDGLYDVLDDVLHDTIGDSEVSFERDLDPWLEREVAMFVSASSEEGEPDVAVIVGTNDEEAGFEVVREAMEAGGSELTLENYQDTDYSVDASGRAVAVVPGHLVYGTEGAVRSSILAHTRNSSLASSKRFRSALALLPEEGIATVYYDPLRVVDALPDDASTLALLEGPLGLKTQKPLAAVAHARDGALVVDLATDLPADERLAEALRRFATRDDLIDDIPDFAWLAFGYPALGDTLSTFLDLAVETAGSGATRAFIEQGFMRETGLDLDGLLSWIGDVRIYAGGTSTEEEEFVFVLETSDEKAAARAIARIGGLLRLQGERVAFPRNKRWRGFSLQLPDGAPLHVVQDQRLPGQVIVAYKAWWNVYIPLAALPKFTDARASLGEGFAPFFYLDGDKMLDYLSNTNVLPFGDADIKADLDQLDSVIAGSKIVRDDAVLQRVVVTLEEQ